MPVANDGLSDVDGEVRVSAESDAIFDSSVTFSVYVLTTVPSSEVTTVVIVLGPVVSVMLPEGDPDATTTELTVIIAVGSVAVGVSVIEPVPLGTDVEYEPVVAPAVNVGLSVVPGVVVKLASVPTFDCLCTVTV